MKSRIAAIPLAALMALSGSGLSAQTDFNFWLSTDGAGVNVHHSSFPMPVPPPPPVYRFGEPVEYYYHPPRPSKKLRKKIKKMQKARKKYYKAREEFFEERFDYDHHYH
ncbi:MAG: hypothetical protein K2L62_04565, partial [Muribaculaceae bacterium]|nr:hypothetical protein [Muribaculaceae bacterium]